LDRLSGDIASLLVLRDSGTKFVAVDMPEADDLTVGIMALIAEAQRGAVSRKRRNCPQAGWEGPGNAARDRCREC